MFFDLTKLKQTKATQIGDMTIHTKAGVVHRDDGPAITTSWSQEWYQNGKLHRADGPARMFLKHPQPTGDAAVAAEGKHIAEWHMNGEYVAQSILDHETFHTHWHHEKVSK